MVLRTVFIRALSWIRGYGVDFNHAADASFEEFLGVIIAGAVSWAASFSLESCAIAVTILALCVQQRELIAVRAMKAKLVSEKNARRVVGAGRDVDD